MALKILACLFMLIDHAGYYFGDLIPYPLYMGMRSIGRLAFPLFAWMVARSIHKTRNPFFYFLRLACFAVVSEVLFRALDLFPALPIYPANVLITFSLSVVLVSGYQLATRSGLDMIASLRPIAPTNNTLPTPPRFDVRINLGGIRLDSRIGLLIGLLMIFLAIMATSWLKSAPCFVPDYDFYGLAAVLTFFIIQERCEEKKLVQTKFSVFFALKLHLRLHQNADLWPGQRRCSDDSSVVDRRHTHHFFPSARQTAGSGGQIFFLFILSTARSGAGLAAAACY
jgi:hypothetical protein